MHKQNGPFLAHWGKDGGSVIVDCAKKGPFPLPLKVRRHERWLCERDQAGRWIPWQRGEKFSFPYLPIFVSPHLSKYLPIFLFHIFHFDYPCLPIFIFHIFPNIFSISSQISFQYLPKYLFNIFPFFFSISSQVVSSTENILIISLYFILPRSPLKS